MNRNLGHWCPSLSAAQTECRCFPGRSYPRDPTRGKELPGHLRSWKETGACSQPRAQLGASPSADDPVKARRGWGSPESEKNLLGLEIRAVTQHMPLPTQAPENQLIPESGLGALGREGLLRRDRLLERRLKHPVWDRRLPSPQLPARACRPWWEHCPHGLMLLGMSAFPYWGARC